MRSYLFVAAIILGAAPAHAQSPVDRALREYQREEIRIIENLLFSSTKKTPQVLYAKRLALGDRNYLYCGEALLGSARQTFAIKVAEGGGVAVGVPPKQLQEMGCSRTDGPTLIDLR